MRRRADFLLGLSVALEIGETGGILVHRPVGLSR
jgi:hypothetical protein